MTKKAKIHIVNYDMLDRGTFSSLCGLLNPKRYTSVGLISNCEICKTVYHKNTKGEFEVIK